MIYRDLDGSLTGQINSVIVYNNNLTMANPNCRTAPLFINGTVCVNTNGWIRFAFNNLKPDLAILANFSNNNQMATIPKLAKRLTHLKGFMAALEANKEYLFEFDQALYPTNISYTAGFYNVEANKYVIIKHRMSKKPDRVLFGALAASETLTALTSSSKTGEWYWDNSTLTLSYIISNSEGLQPFNDYTISFDAYKCRYAGCLPPIQPGYKLPVTSRPLDALYWSNISTWSFTESRAFRLPVDFESVKIPDGKYIVVDCTLPIMKYLQIEGVLEFDNKIDHRLEVEIIFINGGQLIIGWENDPILTNVEIVLKGEKDSIDFYLPDGQSKIGGKGIGVYGGLDLHGRPRYPSWTQLETTSKNGSNQLILAKPVDWLIGESIVIGTTSYTPNETEVFTIIAKSANNKTLTLNSSLKFNHLGFSENYSTGASYSIGAGVGLLSRNIKIIGAEYAKQHSDLYGSRIIVSDYSTFNSDGDIIYYKGYARMSNVELNHPGQYSRNSEDDYKYGVLFSNLQDYNYSRPSYIRNCAFHHGYSAAIGILGSFSIPIEDNVIHHTIDYAIRVEGHSNIIKRNMLVLIYWASTFITWEAEFNHEYFGAVEARDADSIVLEGNFIIGSERLGLMYKGDVCDGEESLLGVGLNHSIKDNMIYSSLSGVVLLPDKFFSNISCVRISGFTVFKSMHWGIYYQNPYTVVIESNVLVDNFVGVFSMVIQPPTIQHLFSGKNIIQGII